MPASYHPGEVAVQARTNLRGPAGNALRGIRSAMPPAAVEFLADQPVIFVGAADASGRLWTSLITGPPGFVTGPREDAVAVARRPGPPDPLAEVLAAPVPVGMIAIEPASRRRMRINGLATPRGDGLLVEVDQVIANCPKYIQKRSPRPDAGPGAGPVEVGREAVLTDRQRRLVEAADTFFISTAALDGSADTSHRGGNPGFVRAPSGSRLSWPDYVGNAMFLTLGNLEQSPVAGLLFVDWELGTTLHLTGTATVDYSPARAATVPGAQRIVDFTVTEVRELTGNAPRWDPPEYSRFNPATAAL